MASPTPELISALRATAHRLTDGTAYQWTHMGACNCGHLAQTVTRKSASEIHALALEKQGDWADKAVDYCENSGYPIDHVIGELLGLGLYIEDIVHLERLSDPDVLLALPSGKRPLNHKQREHVVLYLRTWADQLEAEWLRRTALQLPIAAPRETAIYAGQELELAQTV
jgi:hypothetical protein